MYSIPVLQYRYCNIAYGNRYRTRVHHGTLCTGFACYHARIPGTGTRVPVLNIVFCKIYIPVYRTRVEAYFYTFSKRNNNNDRGRKVYGGVYTRMYTCSSASRVSTPRPTRGHMLIFSSLPNNTLGNRTRHCELHLLFRYRCLVPKIKDKSSKLVENVKGTTWHNHSHSWTVTFVAGPAVMGARGACVGDKKMHVTDR